VNEIFEILDRLSARAEIIAAAFDSVPAYERDKVALAVYRCRIGGCRLLTCWQAPGVRLIRLRNYRLSPSRNAQTTPSGRAKNTTDGDHKWKPRHLVLEDLLSAPEMALDLNCDHVEKCIVKPADVAVDAGRATPGRPTRRFYPETGATVR
jgi:hypothetical protein